MNKEKQIKHEASRKRHNFLIDAFFKNIPDYGINKSVEGWVLEKHINGNSRNYEVNIYTEESFEIRKKHIDSYNIFNPSRVDKT